MTAPNVQGPENSSTYVNLAPQPQQQGVTPSSGGFTSSFAASGSGPTQRGSRGSKKKKSQPPEESGTGDAEALSATASAAAKKIHIWASRFKTKNCEKFTQTGECSFGFRCMFAHGPSDFRTKEMNFRDGLINEEAILHFQKLQWTQEAERHRVTLNSGGHDLAPNSILVNLPPQNPQNYTSATTTPSPPPPPYNPIQGSSSSHNTSNTKISNSNSVSASTSGGATVPQAQTQQQQRQPQYAPVDGIHDAPGAFYYSVFKHPQLTGLAIAKPTQPPSSTGTPRPASPSPSSTASPLTAKSVPSLMSFKQIPHQGGRTPSYDSAAVSSNSGYPPMSGSVMSPLGLTDSSGGVVSNNSTSQLHTSGSGPWVRDPQQFQLSISTPLQPASYTTSVSPGVPTASFENSVLASSTSSSTPMTAPRPQPMPQQVYYTSSGQLAAVLPFHQQQQQQGTVVQQAPTQQYYYPQQQQQPMAMMPQSYQLAQQQPQLQYPQPLYQQLPQQQYFVQQQPMTQAPPTHPQVQPQSEPQQQQLPPQRPVAQVDPTPLDDDGDEQQQSNRISSILHSIYSDDQ